MTTVVGRVKARVLEMLIVADRHGVRGMMPRATVLDCGHASRAFFRHGGRNLCPNCAIAEDERSGP